MTSQGIHRRLPINLTQSLISRFWSRVAKGKANECWEWQAAMRNGYGAIKHQKRVLSAHRVAYVIHNGEPDSKLIVGHKCDNPKCCNPHHLEAITPGKNNRDARGRRKFFNVRGEDVHCSKLTDASIREIRKRHAAGETQRELASAFGVGKSTIGKITTGKNWSHVGTSREGQA